MIYMGLVGHRADREAVPSDGSMLELLCLPWSSHHMAVLCIIIDVLHELPALLVSNGPKVANPNVQQNCQMSGTEQDGLSGLLSYVHGYPESPSGMWSAKQGVRGQGTFEKSAVCAGIKTFGLKRSPSGCMTDTWSSSLRIKLRCAW